MQQPNPHLPFFFSQTPNPMGVSVPTAHPYIQSMVLPAAPINPTQPIPMGEVDGNASLRPHEEHPLSIGQMDIIEDGITMGEGNRPESNTMIGMPAEQSTLPSHPPQSYDYLSELRGNYVNVTTSNGVSETAYFSL